MINWQLSKQGIRWPVSPDRTAGSSVHPSKSSMFWSYPLTNCQFQMIAGSSLFFLMIHMKYVVFVTMTPHYENFDSRGGRPFLTIVTLWSRSTSNFYALIGQNLIGEFMRKIYVASWKWFTLTAEANRVLCQLVMLIFNLPFPLDVQNEIQLLSRVFCYLWLVCLLGFWLRNASLVKIR